MNRSGNSASKGSYPITKAFACILILALVGLFLLHHLFGGVEFKAGVK